MKCTCGNPLQPRRRRGQRTGIDWSNVVYDATDADKARDLGCDRATVTYHRQKAGRPTHGSEEAIGTCVALVGTAERMMEAGRVREAIGCLRMALRDLKGEIL